MNKYQEDLLEEVSFIADHIDNLVMQTDDSKQLLDALRPLQKKINRYVASLKENVKP